MSTNPDTDDLATELSDRTYTAIAYILRQLAQTYLIKIGDTLTVNDTLINTMAQMLGEMIACYPDNEREAVFESVTKNVTYYQDMMVLELADRQKTSADAPKADENGLYDLSRMTPRGNC